MDENNHTHVRTEGIQIGSEVAQCILPYLTLPSGLEGVPISSTGFGVCGTHHGRVYWRPCHSAVTWHETGQDQGVKCDSLLVMLQWCNSVTE